MDLILSIIKTRKADRLNFIERNKLAEKRLLDIVAYAKKNSKYYRKLYKNLGEKFELSQIPVTNKLEMMNNFDDWITDSKVNKDNINKFMENIDNVGRLLNGNYLVFKTSGSTGNPAIVIYDKRNINVASSVAICRTFSRSIDLKKFKKEGRRTAGIFANYGFYLACGMSRYMNLKIPFLKNKITIDVNKPMAEIVRELNEFRPNLLSGYPSNLSILCDQQENGNLDIQPSIIITGGEKLTEDIRRKLSDTFKTHVQTHYSCTEAGEIACECEKGRLHINDDWVIVEAVDKYNNPVPDGIMSEKIFITNLSNYIQPFIRYEITDRVVIHSEGCSCGKDSKWIEIEGRTDDILSFGNDVRIAPMSFYKILQEIKEIKRFQLVQKPKNILELRIVSDDRDLAFAIAKASLEAFLRDKGISVEIILSKDIPKPHIVTGKFKHVYSEI